MPAYISDTNSVAGIQSPSLTYTITETGISIIDLEKTHDLLGKACAFAEDTVASGKDILFIGTKKQAQDIVREVATACSMPFCVNRWMGGGLTNFATIKTSLVKYRKFLKMEADGDLAKLPGKEEAAVRRQMSRMHRNFEGILEINELPAALFVIDTKNEEIAVAEANRLGIPVIGLVDTNSDPSLINYPIPGNDDAVKSIRIIVETLMEAIQSGLSQREAKKVQPAAPSFASRSLSRLRMLKLHFRRVTAKRRQNRPLKKSKPISTQF